MSVFAWCIVGIIVALLVMIWRVRNFGGVIKVLAIILGIAFILFLLIGAIVSYN